MKNQILTLMSLSLSLVAFSAFAQNIDTEYESDLRSSFTSTVTGPEFRASGRSSCWVAGDDERVAKTNAYDSAQETCIEDGYAKVVRSSDFEFQYTCGGCVTPRHPEGRCATKATAHFQCSM